jgi:endonuclease/exonuclease/phosphatase family metal-dependent hydrolase
VGRFACGGPDGDGAAVLLGDLNLPPRVVEPVLRRTGWRTLPAGPTFPSWSPVAQLDHVLVRGRLVMAELQVGAAGPSDHLSLTATVCPPG